MAKYKPYSYTQGAFIPVHFAHQIQPGTFEYTLSRLLDSELDLSLFNSRFHNDENGARAYDPKLLLKIVLFAYSRGITSSRKIARACEENVVFMALSANTRPHFTTIANFVSSLEQEVVQLFRDVLLVCDEMGLIGREMFAIDGCKLPSNASKEWSGTKADFEKKAAKMERAIERIVHRHQIADHSGTERELKKRDDKYIEKLRRHIKKIRDFTDKNDDKPGKTGKPRKSNITDNDSAKMKTSKGVIQGYDGVASVDSKFQIVVHAEAFGEAQEHDLLQPMVAGTEENFKALGEPEVFGNTKLTADSGFHNEANMQMLAEKEIDGYVADNRFRKRDPLFQDAGRYKERHRQERAAFEGRSGLFKSGDFTFAEDLSYALCPAGKRLYRSGTNIDDGKFRSHRFKGPKSACVPCHLRQQCLRKPEITEIRQVAYFHGRSEKGKATFTEKMKHKIDSAVGRFIYSRRLGTVEPVFAHICHVLGLNRFSFRGKTKVNSQWQVFCLVHNLKKIHQFGVAFA
jgi:transposase